MKLEIPRKASSKFNSISIIGITQTTLLSLILRKETQIGKRRLFSLSFQTLLLGCNFPVLIQGSHHTK